MAFFLNISFLAPFLWCVSIWCDPSSLLWPPCWFSCTSHWLVPLPCSPYWSADKLQVHTLNDCGYNVRYIGNTVTGIHYVQSFSYVDEQNICRICSLILNALWRAATLNATRVYKTPIRWSWKYAYISKFCI